MRVTFKEAPIPSGGLTLLRNSIINAVLAPQNMRGFDTQAPFHCAVIAHLTGANKG